MRKNRTACTNTVEKLGGLLLMKEGRDNSMTSINGKLEEGFFGSALTICLDISQYT